MTLSLSCGEPTSSDPSIPDWDGSFDVTAPLPPQLTPCPEGWDEVAPDGPGDVTTCDPWPGQAPVALPVLTPCPTGWEEGAPDAEGDPPTCEPWPTRLVAARPVLTPCPPGWNEVPPSDSLGSATCEPWPVSGGSGCAEGEARFVGDSECRHLGTECGTDEWAVGLPEDGTVLYVRAGELEAGDGSRRAPFATIAAALAVASSGAVIALSRGSFDEAVELPAGAEVTLWGACVADTILNRSGSEELESIVRASGAAELRNLTITGEGTGVFVAGEDASLIIQAVEIISTRGAGILVSEGATVSAEDLVVRNTRAFSLDGSLGRGIDVNGGATVEISRGIVEGNSDTGIFSYGVNTTVMLEDIVVRDTDCNLAFPTGGTGIFATDGGRIEVVRGLLEGNRSEAVLAQDDSSSLLLRDVVIRGTEADCEGTYGSGLVAIDGARVAAERLWIVDNLHSGAAFFGQRTEGTLEDVVVEGTRSNDSGYYGEGVLVDSGARVSIARAVVTENVNSGVYAGGDRTWLEAEDLVVSNTQSRPVDGQLGAGFLVMAGANADLSRSELRGNRAVGLYVLGPSCYLRAEQVVVSETLRPDLPSPIDDRWRGTGISVSNGGRASIEQVAVENSADVGCLATDEDSLLEVRHFVVRDTEGPAAGEGAGLRFELGALGVLERGLVERNGVVGITIMSEGSQLSLTDVIVRETSRRPDEPLEGAGFEAFDGASVEMERVLFADNERFGVSLNDRYTEATVEDLVVRNTTATDDDNSGIGLFVDAAATASVDRAVLIFNDYHGARIQGSGTTADLQRIVFRSTGTLAGDAPGFSGLTIDGGARAVVTGSLLEQNQVVVAIRVAGAGSELVAHDVVIRETLENSEIHSGVGLFLSEGATAELTRVVMDDNRTIGLLAMGEGTSLTAADLVVRYTSGQEGDGLLGRAIEFEWGAIGRFERVLLLENQEISVVAFGEGTNLGFIDTAILRTRPQACPGIWCIEEGLSVGAGSYAGANIDLERFVIAENASCGLQLAHGTIDGEPHELGGNADLRDGEVSDNGIGVNLQIVDFDIERLMDRVIYFDNERNLDAIELPVPDIRL